MSKIVKIRLRNTIAQDIELCLEPEGTIIPFLAGEERDIEVSESDGTSIEIVIGKSSDGLNLAFWPDQGKYNISDPE